MHTRGSFALETEDAARERYEVWLAQRDYEAVEVGSGNVGQVAWHGAPFAGEVAAATFENEADAAVHTLRRQAFGRIYRDCVTEPV